ncbi:MAG: 50S ribosomal protein L32 [bacterium]|jgi:large subunit ribosomal protein L32
MAHPKHRKSKSKTRMKRAHHALSPRSLVECPNCRSSKLPHRVCPNCGFYKGQTV